MAPPIRVAVIGATGKTGKSIVDGLLASPTNFEITALTRESSLTNAANDAFRAQGVKVVAFDILGSKGHLKPLFNGLDVLISCTHFTQLEAQLNLIDVAKEAGVKRFVPCTWGPSAPPGVMRMHDRKLEIEAAIQRAYLPYTIIDVGWWYDGVMPPLPSGRTNSALMPGNLNGKVHGPGIVPTALTDVNDIGLYVSHIIADPRTLNKKVLAYTEVLTLNEIWDLVAKLSGETPHKDIVTAEDVTSAIKAAKQTLAAHPSNPDFMAMVMVTINEYLYSLFVRGDNTPQAAKYLGYLDFKDLYPDVVGLSARDFYKHVLEGKRAGVYAARSEGAYLKDFFTK